MFGVYKIGQNVIIASVRRKQKQAFAELFNQFVDLLIGKLKLVISIQIKQ